MKQETKKHNHHQSSRADHYVSAASPANSDKDSVKVINIDKSGNVIEDLSKVKLPKELQLKIYKVLEGRVKKVNGRL